MGGFGLGRASNSFRDRITWLTPHTLSVGSMLRAGEVYCFEHQTLCSRATLRRTRRLPVCRISPLPKNFATEPIKSGGSQRQYSTTPNGRSFFSLCMTAKGCLHLLNRIRQATGRERLVGPRWRRKRADLPTGPAQRARRSPRVAVARWRRQLASNRPF